MQHVTQKVLPYLHSIEKCEHLSPLLTDINYTPLVNEIVRTIYNLKGNTPKDIQ